MRHRPFFRWVVTAGMVLIAGSFGLYQATPDPAPLPKTRQIDLVVLEERPDGTCRVQWSDPFERRDREAPFHCDPTRSDSLKAPQYGNGSGYGWESGFIRTENPHRGELYEYPRAGESPGVASKDWRTALSDDLLGLGLLLAAGGLVGGNVRALSRVAGVQSRLLRRAARLQDAAVWVARDHQRALGAVRRAWGDTPVDASWEQDRSGARGTELVTALRVLAEAGPEAGAVAEAGRDLARRLDELLADAAPAASYAAMLRAGPESRRRARTAVAELHPLLEEAERAGLLERFAQASVDLLRGQDTDPAGLAAWTDFERDPATYRALLANAVDDVSGASRDL
ncbi:hypothetical protein [Streptomyces sp. NPDC004788]